MDIAKSVVESRNLQGMVIDSRSLRSTAEGFPGPVNTSTTTPESCSAVPLDAGQSPTSTIAFVMRSAANDKLAAADFNGTDGLMSTCARFERAFTLQVPGGGAGGMTTTFEVQLSPAPPVGQKAYATVQKAKGLGAADMGAAGMQVLAGTISIELALSLWPVNQETTARALDSMAGLARELIDQAVKNPPSSPRPIPTGARSPDELARLLAGVTGPAGTKLYVSPTEARTITRAAGPVPLPSRIPCAYDDAAYFAALAEGATMAKAIASTEDKMIAFDVTAVSMGSAVQQPFPFDARAAAVKDCTAVEANIIGKGKLSLDPVRHVAVGIEGDSSYAFSYQVADQPGRWYIALGARRGQNSVEVSTSAWRPLEEDAVESAVEAATAVIQQALR
ncbi:hypothetical protein FHJ30_17000 [Arthrobacter sp. BB-1]|uniref:hypothetical protein n=1 Tax=unclassified Arthrobacter TaxID=235627 RepID=UPI0011124D22|nr:MULTISPECIES: hypothetical protein [unclassified Arthrobacter]TNB70005.1 hypothetical protein FHJ30_17000 [Arthrobacter sp. BB-1]